MDQVNPRLIRAKLNYAEVRSFPFLGATPGRF